MLIEFTVGNYLSFAEKKTISLASAGIREFVKENTLKVNGLQLLKSALIYGPNASGKSNLLKALRALQKIVLTSIKNSPGQSLPVESFKLSADSENEPSFFEIAFAAGEKKYRYGLTCNKDSIFTEWLYEIKPSTEELIFARDSKSINIGKRYKSMQKLSRFTRPNVAFVSVLYQFNDITGTRITEWFSKIQIILTSDIIQAEEKLHELINSKNKEKLNVVSKYFNLGISDFESIWEDSGIKDPIWRDEIIIRTQHEKRDANGKMIGFTGLNFNEHESAGTKRLIYILVLLLSESSAPGILVLDEIESSLHPVLVVRLINFIHEDLMKTASKQYIFTTHDTNILRYANLRRDQIYFTEKNRFGATDLYSLVEFKSDKKGKIRSDESYDRNYLKGKYGAIPFFKPENLAELSK